jgi:hypothetical protein
VNRKVSKEEMAARVSQIYSGKVKINKCPKAHSLKRPAGPVSPRTILGCFFLLVAVRHLTRWSLSVVGSRTVVLVPSTSSHWRAAPAEAEVRQVPTSGDQDAGELRV